MRIRSKRAIPLTWQFALIAWTSLILAATILAEEEVTSPKDDKEERPEGEGLDTDSQQQVSILKHINRVNDDGSYTFGYEAADGSFKVETRDVVGNVKGTFGFVDESGQLKRVSYSSNNGTGFQADGVASQDEIGGSKEEIMIDTAPPNSTPSPLIYQQILRPHMFMASAPSTVESVMSKRPIFRPSNPRASLQDTSLAASSSKISDPTTRKPIVLYGQHISISTETDETTTQRSSVIQTIPKKHKRPQEVSSTTGKPLVTSTSRRPLTPIYGHYIRQQNQPTLVPSGKVLNHSAVEDKESPVTPPNNHIIFGHYLRAPENTPPTTPAPTLRRVLVTRKPLPNSEVSKESSSEVITGEESGHSNPTDDSSSSKEGKYHNRRLSHGNGLRRQLTSDRDGFLPGYGITPSFNSHRSSSTDTSDVYGGSTLTSTPRTIPSVPFRSYFTSTGRPRVVDDALLQSQNGGGVGRPRIPPSVVPYQQDEDDLRATLPTNGGRFPVGGVIPGDGGYRIPPPSPYQPQSEDNQGQYPQQVSMRDFLSQLMQYLIDQQLQQRQYDVNYRSQLTPFQIALMQMLGVNIPPQLLDDAYQPQGPYNPRRPTPPSYPQQQDPYYPYDDPSYNQQYQPYPNPQIPYPTQNPYSGRRRFRFRPRPQYIQPQPPLDYDDQLSNGYNPQIPYNPNQQQSNGYNPQIPYNPNQQQSNGYNPQIPYNPNQPQPNSYNPQIQPQPNFLPRYFPIQPRPYDNPEVQYSQPPSRGGSRNSPIGVPQEYLPEEYRDAMFLRMLLTARAQQSTSRGIPQQFPTMTELGRPRPTYLGQDASTRPVYESTPRPVYVRPDPTQGSLYYGQDSSTSTSSRSSTTTTGRPRTLAPVRNVQILDPVTEPSTAKRSTMNSTAPP